MNYVKALLKLRASADTLRNNGGFDSFTFDENKIDRILRKYKVGSILNVPANKAQPREVWHKIITRIQEESFRNIGIPSIYGADQIHGTRYT